MQSLLGTLLGRGERLGLSPLTLAPHTAADMFVCSLIMLLGARLGALAADAVANPKTNSANDGEAPGAARRRTFGTPSSSRYAFTVLGSAPQANAMAFTSTFFLNKMGS